MAHLIPFSFQPGSTLIHCLDVRIKFFLVCLLSIFMVTARVPALVVYTGLLVFLYKKADINGWAMIKSMKLFLLLLFFIFITRSLTTPGKELLSFWMIRVTDAGIYTGLFVAFKFFLVMMTGLLFASTTRPASVKHAVQWILKPVPFIPEKRVAVIISIALAFMPRILSLRHRIIEAQAARCGDVNRRPIRKIIQQMLPLMKKIFLSADQMVLAMESRCYTDDRTDPEFILSGYEFKFFIAGLALAVFLFFF